MITLNSFAEKTKNNSIKNNAITLGSGALVGSGINTLLHNKLINSEINTRKNKLKKLKLDKDANIKSKLEHLTKSSNKDAINLLYADKGEQIVQGININKAGIKQLKNIKKGVLIKAAKKGALLGAGIAATGLLVNKLRKTRNDKGKLRGKYNTN